jgi:carbonic anhydrase
MRKILTGIVHFREHLLPQYKARLQALADKQAPNAMLITCADSRLLPDVFMSVDPGELFVMRNVGNMIPPATVHGESTGDLSEASAIEYSVLALKVRHLIVCGHSGCGAMKAALDRKPMNTMTNLSKWLHHSSSAVFRLDQEGPLDPSLGPHDQLSQLNVLVQLEHLTSYPIVRERLANGTLRLSGWWFDIAQGEMLAYRRESRSFEAITGETMEQMLLRLEPKQGDP